MLFDACLARFVKAVELWHLITAIVGEHRFYIESSRADKRCRFTGYIAWKVVYRVYIWPRWVSPLRHLPGPPMGNPILGQIMALISREADVTHRDWVEQYGPTAIRVMAPLGREHVLFTKPEALHQIFVGDWLDFPRVSLPVALQSHCEPMK